MTLLDTLVLAVAELIMHSLGIVVTAMAILIILALIVLIIIFVKDVILSQRRNIS